MGDFSIGSVLLCVAALAALVLLARLVLKRGPQTITCPVFWERVEPNRRSQLIRDIQRDARPPVAETAVQDEEEEVPDPLSHSIKHAVECTHQGVARSESCDILLLSGGGQWGAYGAGLFEALSKRPDGKPALDNIRIITGISTGSLQTLLLMVALDPEKDAEVRALAIERLVQGYNPDHEREVVHNTGMLLVPFTGSQAGTAPLRRRIAHALRPHKKISLIEEIASSTIDGFIGFVEADTGDFRYADVKRLIAGLDEKGALACLTAATMGSSAMPVFHQQLRVKDPTGARTIYDGGVRRSVFYDKAMEKLDREVRSRLGAEPEKHRGVDFAQSYNASAPTVYVVRNGPTVRKRDTSLNKNASAIPNGKRGYDLLVNESEVGAIAALRLYNPYGTILVTTADEYGEDGTKGLCVSVKDERKMFDPDFMDCLRELGRRKATREGGPWWPLTALERPPAPSNQP